ncbi:unnamed protein product [Rotaria socialis]|uniref:Aminopeptidase n=1 Tax=Rotaria socialis TaxID=392032 RepID=A0A821J1U8_9BILA|nr:unnamed protein product [Rotaria socialis]CAF4712542.1 unnamed protein product [Rotaria socialis]
MSSRRLSRSQNVIPKHYDVHLTTDLDSGQFCGSVKIDLIVKQHNQTSIKLDASHLLIELSSISLIIISSSIQIDCTVEVNESNETLEIRLTNEQTFSFDIPYRLIINSFSGHVTTQNHIGFYRSTVDILSYNDNNSNEMSIVKKHYGITQMSPTHCRRVFPCFDEPSLRATFDLTLDIPRHMQALSNMPQLYAQDNLLNSGTKRIRFQQTPSMPTFLLCFVIGEFDMIQAEPVERLKKDSGLSPIELTAYTLPGRKHEATFALNCAHKALHYYADLFQIDYPMSKLDLVAVPDLFYPAMEDWALILFKEEEMLINEDHAVSVQYRNVCQSVTHEIAHQWFGNLVSIHWWNDVYVVEGFAKWFEYLATDYIVPEYNVFSEFFSTQFVRYFDYCINILHSEADDIDEKDFSFEGFIYSKGSCLMRMLHLFVGQNHFLDSTRLFLNRYSYRTATAIDFWACVEEITNLPIKKLVHSWCSKKSYPVVQVKMIGYDETTGIYDLELKQMSFCRGHNQDKKPHDKKISCHCIRTSDLICDTKRNLDLCQSIDNNDNDENWIIPITILNSQSDCLLTKFLITKNQEIIHINTNSSLQTEEQSIDNEPATKKRRSSSLTSNWLKLNVCSGGPYRVLYSSDMLEQLTQAIVKQELNTFDRFNLENDMYALAMGGFTSLVDYLRLLLNAYVNELDDELVWKDIESNIIRIGTLLEYDKQLFDFYRQFVICFHQNLYQRLGLTSNANNELESVARGRLRCFLLVILGTIGHDPTIISNARERLLIYLNDPSTTVLWPICAIVAHHASDSDLNNLFKLWEQCPRRDDRLRCAYGLSYIQEPSQIERVLNLFSTNNSTNTNNTNNNGNSIRLHERIECYKGFCLSKQGRYYYQRYIEDNWLSLRTSYNDEYLEALVRETFGYFSTKDEAIRIEDFFLSYETFHQKYKMNLKETPATPCTRIAVHLCLDDNELLSMNKNSLSSPIHHHRSIVPNKVKEVASIIAHTTRTRAALLERDRDDLFAFFQSNSFPILSLSSNASSQISSVSTTQVLPSCSLTLTTSGNKRKRPVSSLNASNSSPPVRNLLASDTIA